MRYGRFVPETAAVLPLLLCCFLIIGCGTPRPRFEPETIHRLNQSPALHVGRAVILHGVAVEPLSGDDRVAGSLGSYLLRDGAGDTVRVLSRRPPPGGANCRVTGFVGQTPENALVPLVLEAQRSRPHRDLWVILGLLLLVIGSLPLAVIRFRRHRRMPGSGHGFPGPPQDASAVRPGVAYILDLEVVAGSDMGRRHTFRSDRILVGRPGLRHNDLSLDDHTVSRTQAVILRDEKIGGYKIRNEGRTNPLKVNGRPCDAVALRDGDLLTVGLTTLLVRYREPEPTGGEGKGNGFQLILALLACFLTAAGELPARSGSDGSVVLERLDLRELPMATCRFRVPGPGGPDRLGLGPADFRLLVDGRPLEPVELRSQADPGQRLPRIALVVQTSRQERGRGLFLLKSAVSGFLDRLPQATAAALISHGAEVRSEQGFTTDRRLLLQQLEAVPLGEPSGGGSYYAALERAVGMFGTGEPGPSVVIYFCRPGPFTREDMRPDAPKGLRAYPGVRVYPVLSPELDGNRTSTYLRQLALKLTEGFTGHYTLNYRSPGGEDNRVHSLRIDWIPPGRVSGAACRYLASSGSGLESDGLLAQEYSRSLMDRLAGGLIGLLAGGLAFRWIAGGTSAGRGPAGQRAASRLRVHFLIAGAMTGFLLSLMIGRVI